MRKCCDCGDEFDPKTERQIRCAWCLVAKHDLELP